MKSRNLNPLRLAVRSANLLSLCTITLSVLAAGHAMAQDTWDGGAGNGLWSDATNWADDSAPVPATAGVLTFAGGVQTTTNNDLTGVVTTNILFTNDGVANTAAFTVGGTAITLGGNVTTTAIASGGSAITDTISAELTSAGTRTINTGLGHDLIISGALTSGGNLSKGGNGTLTLSNTSNSYTGKTFVDAGVLKLGASNVLSGNTLDIKRANEANNLNSNPIVDLSGYSDTVGAIDLGNNAPTLTGAGANLGEQSSIIDSAVTKGLLTIGGNITYRAGSGGAGNVNGQSTISANISNGSTNRDIAVGDGIAASDLLISGKISGSGAYNKTGAGTLELSGTNDYTGITTITGGTVQVNQASTGLGDSTAVNAINLNAGTLSLRNDGAGSNGAVLYGSTSNATGYKVQLSAPSTINVANLTANTGNTIQLGALTQATAGVRTLNVTGASGYSLTLASLGLNPGLGQSTTLNPTSANLIITGNVNNPMTGFSLSTQLDTLILGGTSTGNRIGGTISDAVGGSLAAGGTTRVTKDGTSTWELTNTSTYTGVTNVEAGTLFINGGSIGTSDVNVNGGILASGATGTIGKTVLVKTGATLAAGGSGAVGVASVLNNLTFNSGSIFDWDLTTGAGDGTYDTVSVTGTLGITSGAKFNVVSSTPLTDTFWDASHTWSNIFGAQAIDNFLTANFLYSGSVTAPTDEGSFTISGSALTWTAVPEPTSALAGLLIGAGLLRRRRA